MNRRRGSSRLKDAFGRLGGRFKFFIEKGLKLPLGARKNRRRFSFARNEASANADGPSHSPKESPQGAPLGKRLWLLVSPLAVALLAFSVPYVGVRAYEYVMRSEHFHVRQVFVDQAHPKTLSLAPNYQPMLNRDALLELAGIGAGTHVLDADITAMTERLMAHPWVRWAHIERQLPDTLVVHVVEHIPQALLAAHYTNTSESQPLAPPPLFLIDEVGVVFTEAPTDRVLNLPVVTGVAVERLEDPNVGYEVRRELEAALNVLRLWRAQQLSGRYPVAELRLLPGGSFALVLEPTHGGGITEVVLGRSPFREKFFRLEWILEHLHSQGAHAEYILLDLADDQDPRAISLGGARVVVKTDLALRDPLDQLDHLEQPPPQPAPAASAAQPAEDVIPPELSSEALPLSGGRPADAQEEE